jgi:hypothetical protein
MFNLLDFMAPPKAKKPDAHRPRPLQNSKSWSRIAPESPGRSTRNQGVSVDQNVAVLEMDNADNVEQPSTPREGQDNLSKMQSDSFEKSSDEDGQHEALEGIAGRRSVDCDDLPIELISLTDRLVLCRSRDATTIDLNTVL